MDDRKQFSDQRAQNVLAQGKDRALQDLGLTFMRETARHNYTYNFTWMGLPIIQFPQDLMALQEIIWGTRPDVVVEVGIARGGGVIFLASMLELVGGNGFVVGVDVDIRPHNREEIEHHRLSHRVRLVEGSSIDPKTVAKVTELAQGKDRVMVVLDSNHTHAHVLSELRQYSPLVKAGQFLCVMDTTIEDQPEELFAGRPWKRGNSPKTAVHEFLKGSPRFSIDKTIEDKLLITVARDGYLRAVS